MNVGARMAIPHPPDHLLITVCIPRVSRMLAAAAAFTRNLGSNTIQEEATLRQVCSPRIGMPLNTKNPISGQKVPGSLVSALTVSDVHCINSFIKLFVGHGRLCRLPNCNRNAFFDRRINELREWCSDEHMQCEVHISLHNSALSYLLLGLR
jgi:hypothetical protein